MLVCVHWLVGVLAESSETSVKIKKNKKLKKLSRGQRTFNAGEGRSAVAERGAGPIKREVDRSEDLKDCANVQQLVFKVCACVCLGSSPRNTTARLRHYISRIECFHLIFTPPPSLHRSIEIIIIATDLINAPSASLLN